MNLRRYALLLPVIALLLTAGCEKKTETPSSAKPGGSTPVDTAAYQNLQAVIETERGNIIVEFYPQDAPKTVENFVTLAKKGFYNGLTFHRVEPGFVVQGGDPEGTGAGGPGYTIPAEFNKQKHLRGTLAMARTSDPNSAGSQFYICLSPQPSLDNSYTVFGQVVKGMENVDKIKKGDHMIKVTIGPKGEAAPAGGASPAAAPSGAASPAAAPSGEASPAAH